MTDPPERDRDVAGRALNARPRDELGRPLAYGATGVARAPEGQRRSPEQTLRSADELLRAGRPFHAHEVFEDAWKTAEGTQRELWRGLAQLAVGLTHLARGYPDRAARLLDRGHQSLSRYRDLTGNHEPSREALRSLEAEPPLDVDAVLSWASTAGQRCRETADASALDLAPIPLIAPAEHDGGG